jgi:hypothetical protein
MDPYPEDSQLALLSPSTKPDCQELLTDLRFALNRAANFQLWDRMEFCHNARYVDFPGHNRFTCRKGLAPGTRPWGGAADLEVRLVDQIIKENSDICVLAANRAQPHVMPADLEADDDDRMNMADLWGGVLEHYREYNEYNMQRALTELCGIGQEYGHGIMFVGWHEEKRLVKKTLDAGEVNQLLAHAFINPDADAPDIRDYIASLIEKIDPEILPTEARRVAGRLKTGEPCDYSVPITVRATPDWRAKTPGLDIFYPPETVTIQEAQFVVETEWLSDTQMRGNVVTWKEWDKKAVEAVIKNCRPGRAAFFAGLTTGVTSASAFTWQLTSGMIGLSIGLGDLTGEQAMRQWQIIVVRYKAIDPKTGVPVLYETTFHPDLPDQPLSHKWSVDEHAQYPYVEYKREMTQPTLWSSRGIGELSYSEQEEIRAQRNFCFDNANIAIMPPYQTSPRSTVANDGLRPGMRIDAIAGQPNAVGVINVAGDSAPSIEVQKIAWNSAKDYHKQGMSEDMDPVAKQTAQQNVVSAFILSLKQAYKLTFAVIQQFAPDEIRYSCLNGMPVDVRVSREEILGQFKVYLEFDVADIDPKSIEMRGKMVGEIIQPLDNAGLLDSYGMLKLLLMSISPTWGRQMLKKPQQAQQDEISEAVMNLIKNLNGVETQYRQKGGDPNTRLQTMQQILSMPAIGTDGKPMLNPETGQPMPGRAAQIYQSDPAAAALVQRTMMNEKFLLDQQNNANVGKVGVKQAEQTSSPGAS